MTLRAAAPTLGRFTIALTAATVGLAAMTAGAAADGGWADSTQLSPIPGKVLSPTVTAATTGQDGRLAVAWVQDYPTEDRILVSWRSPGSGSFTVPVPASAAGEQARSPIVGIDGDGRTVVAYRDIGPNPDVLRMAIAPAAAFGAPATIGIDVFSSADVTRSIDGNLWFAWSQRASASAFTTQTARLARTATNMSSSCTHLEHADDALSTTAAQDARVAAVGGAVVTTWTEGSGGRWGRADTCSESRQLSIGTSVDIAGNAAGEALIAGSEGARRMAPEGCCPGAPIPGDPGPVASYEGHSPAVSLSSNGLGTLVANGGNHAYSWARGGSLSANSTNPLMPAAGDFVRLAADDNGKAVALWGTDGTVHSTRRRDASDSFSMPAVISQPGATSYWPSVETVGPGRAVGFWLQESPDGPQLRTADYTANGPAISSVSAPQTITTGASGQFEAQVGQGDRAITTITWRFGDGNSNSGNPVQHAYGAPGTYSGSVTVTDAVGNEQTSEFSVTAQAPMSATNPGPSVATAPIGGGLPPPAGGGQPPVQPGLTPPLADRTPPSASLSGSRVLKLGRSLSLGIRCASENCTAQTSGTVRVPKRGRASAKTYRLPGVTKRIARGVTARVTIRLSKTATAAILRSLRQRGRPSTTLKFRVVVADSAGNERTLPRSISVTR